MNINCPPPPALYETPAAARAQTEDPDPDLPAWARALVFEDNVPIPQNRATTGKDVIYEKIKHMRVGQSFVVPYVRTGKDAGVVKDAGVLKAGNLARATGYKFTQRTFVADNGDTMLRIWRTQ